MTFQIKTEKGTKMFTCEEFDRDLICVFCISGILSQGKQIFPEKPFGVPFTALVIENNPMGILLGRTFFPPRFYIFKS